MGWEQMGLEDGCGILVELVQDGEPLRYSHVSMRAEIRR